ncbi:hypothetical protein UFOVP435_51 [uncultured Caudovirales phage]|uniref:Uncharacterized protein n=1 Tax=uncultured Caudovirales phage TaxID=2100421 RepID=A0A6J5M7K5_9CAUD|nr:hypothetical protein UFOVP435_51 [uncultured Caudovirales phage]
MSETIKLPYMPFDLYSGIRDIDQFNGVQDYARLSVEQNTEALRAELSAALARAEAAEVIVENATIEIKRMRNETFKVEDERDAALAKVARYETLTLGKPSDALLTVIWWTRGPNGQWIPSNPLHGTHHSPLPDVKEPAK